MSAVLKKLVLQQPIATIGPAAAPLENAPPGSPVTATTAVRPLLSLIICLELLGSQPDLLAPAKV